MYKILKKMAFFLIVVNTSSFADTYEQNTDITDQLNKDIMKGGIVSIPAGIYKIDTIKSVVLKSDTTLKLDPQTKLIAIPNAEKSYQFFKIHDVKNVTISGGTLIGDKYSHLKKSGEWGMGIDIKDSQNVNISNININQMWGDAIYLGTNYRGNPNNQISLKNVKMDDNRRQGLTIVSAKNLYANDLVISNTKGTSPANGIDIEPNDNKAFLDNLNFTNIRTMNNKGNGMQISLTKYNNTSKKVKINLNNHEDNGSYFGLIINGINKPIISGSINVSNSDYLNSRHSNYCFTNVINNNLVINLDNITQDKKNNFKSSKFCTDYTKNQNIKIKNNFVIGSN
ncbi:right-handed parallel beta-helix repeat-containing protein [Acinetobacter oleivorans]|uniref:right-handed parallel beta-helix repeat-containing protein n=1 Tax=Acinetobacter oleivorans TaxID=1148157 RepID=UPI003F58DB0A